MKKTLIIGTYVSLLAFGAFVSSCEDDPIVPNDPTGNNVDTTWNSGGNDSTFCDPNGGGNPNDSTYYDPNGGGNPNDSTGWNDPTGGGTPGDSIGG